MYAMTNDSSFTVKFVNVVVIIS